MTYNKETLKEAIIQKLRLNYGCTEKQATDGEMMKACAMVLRDIMAERGVQTREETFQEGRRKVHYLSMEFLMGRSLMKNAYNLELLDPLTDAIDELGFKAADIFEIEPDAGLGNGGLGRLAACYLDSMTTLDIPAAGYSICYELGIFKQKIVEGQQVELPDDWMQLGDAWLLPKLQEAEEVRFGGTVDRREENGRMVYELRDYRSVLATPYDVPILGYGAHAVNNLRLWRAGPVHKQLDLDAFNAGDYSRAQKANNDAEAITCLLYPDDNTPGGIKASGAKIVTYGAPVLPGAMFLLGYYDDGTPVMGLPGCVMYAGATIFDLVLPFVAADVPVTRAQIVALGEGGLCLGCKPCHWPTCPFGK